MLGRHSTTNLNWSLSRKLSFKPNELILRPFKIVIYILLNIITLLNWIWGLYDKSNLSSFVNPLIDKNTSSVTYYN